MNAASFFLVHGSGTSMLLLEAEKYKRCNPGKREKSYNIYWYLIIMYSSTGAGKTCHWIRLLVAYFQSYTNANKGTQVKFTALFMVNSLGLTWGIGSGDVVPVEVDLQRGTRIKSQFTVRTLPHFCQMCLWAKNFEQF